MFQMSKQSTLSDAIDRMKKLQIQVLELLGHRLFLSCAGKYFELLGH